MASALDTQFWSTHDTDGGKRCGHCNNCLRPPESIEKQDVTLAAWQLLKLVDNTKQNGALLTFAELVKVARGNKNQKVVNSMKDLTGSNVVLSSEVCAPLSCQGATDPHQYWPFP